MVNQSLPYYEGITGYHTRITGYNMLTGPKRTAVIVTRVTPMEREAIITRATKAGKSVSDYVRGAAMHYAVQGHSAVTDTRAVPSRFLSSSDGRGGA